MNFTLFSRFALFSIMLLCCSCGGDDNEADLRFTMIAKSGSNPVFAAARKGAEDAAEDLEQQNGVSIKIDWQTPAEEDAQEQAKRIDEAVEARSDGILVSCTNADILEGPINRSVAAGVPVMTFDSDSPRSLRFSYFGADDVEAGRMIMVELARVLQERGTIAVLAGREDAPNLIRRTNGVLNEAENHPNIRIAGIYYHEETAAAATAKVLEVMAANPEISGWAMIGGWPLFEKTLLSELDPARVQIVAMDALPTQLAYVEAGLAPVLIAQPVYDWGAVSVRRMFSHIYLKEAVPESEAMALVKVNRDNVAAWRAQLVSWGLN